MVKWVYSLADSISQADNSRVKLARDIDPVTVVVLDRAGSDETLLDLLAQATDVLMLVSSDNLIFIGTRSNIVFFNGGRQQNFYRPQWVYRTLTEVLLRRYDPVSDAHLIAGRTWRANLLGLMHKAAELYPQIRVWGPHPEQEIVLAEPEDGSVYLRGVLSPNAIKLR